MTLKNARNNFPPESQAYATAIEETFKEMLQRIIQLESQVRELTRNK